MEADRQAEHKGYVWQTLRAIAGRLDELDIPYAVVGGIAMQFHGIQRSTQDLDLLIGSEEELAALHASVVGHGFTRKGPESRHLRDDITRIRVEFLLAGDYPGDGQRKPVAFPRPETVSVRGEDALYFVNLRALIELKLASAISAPYRLRDRADVLELIHLHGLGEDYAGQLDPYVQQAFRELAALPRPRDDR